MAYIYIDETTPYGVKKSDDGWVVFQHWWGRAVSPAYATEAEAEAACVEEARCAGVLRRVRVRVADPARSED